MLRSDIRDSTLRAEGNQKIHSENVSNIFMFNGSPPPPELGPDTPPTYPSPPIPTIPPPRTLKSPAFRAKKKRRYLALWDTRYKSQTEMEKLLHEMRGILREIKPEFDKFAKDLKLQVSVGQDEWKTKSQETINLAQLLKDFDKRYDAIASEEVSRVQNLFAGKEVWEVKIEIEKARDKAKRISDWFTRHADTPRLTLKPSYTHLSQAVHMEAVSSVRQGSGSRPASGALSSGGASSRLGSDVPSPGGFNNHDSDLSSMPSPHLDGRGLPFDSPGRPSEAMNNDANESIDASLAAQQREIGHRSLSSSITIDTTVATAPGGSNESSTPTSSTVVNEESTGGVPTEYFDIEDDASSEPVAVITVVPKRCSPDSAEQVSSDHQESQGLAMIVATFIEYYRSWSIQPRKK